MLNTAISTIQDEHRSLSAVIHGLRYLVREARVSGKPPNFKLLWAMLYYIDSFPDKLHNPKENTYLFARLRARTHDADQLLADLERQHLEVAEHARALEQALGHFEAGADDGLERFSVAVEKFAEETWTHMNQEEKVLLPLAKKYLSAEDWVEIAEAFGTNGDPRFGADPDNEFRHLFTRIVNLAPPPIGVGPVRR